VVNRLPLAFLLASSMLFFGASGMYVAALRSRRPGLPFWAHAVALSGWLTLTAGGLVRLGLWRSLPFGAFSDGALLLLWAVAGGFLWLERRYLIRVGGALVLPLLALASAYIFWRPAGGGELLPALASPWVTVHAASVFAAYSAFALAAVAGALYLILERELKRKQLTGLRFSLPDLDTLERLVRALVVLGFPFLTLGLLSGAFWSRRVWGAYLLADPKVIFAWITWLIYGLQLLYWRAAGGRGRRTAIASLIGLLAVAVNYLALGALVDTVHRF